MTKADLVADIANKTGVDRGTTQVVVETFMSSVKDSLLKKENVYLRGFGSFLIKERAKKTGRNITKGTTIVIPAHKVPAFKAAKSFSSIVKAKLK
jgi:DNA-binding protein HU-beta